MPKVITAKEAEELVRMGEQPPAGAILTPSARDVFTGRIKPGSKAAVSAPRTAGPIVPDYEFKWTPGSDPKTPAEIERFFNSPEIEALKVKICDIGRRIWEKNYVDGNGGNITLRVGDNLVICTPTLISKGFMTRYSIGTALPMFLIMYGGNKITNSTSALAPYTETLRKIFGALMIGGALAIAFHFDVTLQQIAVKYFPMISIDSNEAVKKELEQLQKEPAMNKFSSSAPGAHAPDFVGISQWFNSPPLTLEQLKNKVVLIDFWTYSCINCVRTLPYLKNWYAKYKDKGFVIVGVHTPEFEFEKNPANVQDAIKRFGISYPVALDNHFSTWQTYHNRYWPAHYLLDQNGIISYTHFGEGEYLKTENSIRSLLGLQEISERESREPIKPQTPETYLGIARASQYHPDIRLQANATNMYDYKGRLADDQVGLHGSWLVADESITAKSNDARLDINFIGNRVYLVMSAASLSLIEVLLDGKPVDKKYYTVDMNEAGTIPVKDSRMYDILDLKGDNGRHVLTVKVPKDVTLYVFTFGSGEK